MYISWSPLVDLVFLFTAPFCSLRLFSLVPLALAFFTARRLVNLPRDIYTTSALLTLTTHLLASNPFLLVLSPAILLITLLASIPFLTLSFRLLLIGYFIKPSSGWEWHVKGWANWAISVTIAIWLWSWGVARGVVRTTTAGVVASWYFAECVELSIFMSIQLIHNIL